MEREKGRVKKQPLAWFRQQSLYGMLGLQRGGSLREEDVIAAHRRLARVYHPDKGGGGEDDVAVMALLNEARATLCDPERRSVYDAELDVKEVKEARDERVEETEGSELERKLRDLERRLREEEDSHRTRRRTEERKESKCDFGCFEEECGRLREESVRLDDELRKAKEERRKAKEEEKRLREEQAQRARRKREQDQQEEERRQRELSNLFARNCRQQHIGHRVNCFNSKW